LSEYENLTPKGAWLRSCDYFRKFRTPFISLERPKIETSYFINNNIHTKSLCWQRGQTEPGLVAF